MLGLLLRGFIRGMWLGVLKCEALLDEALEAENVGSHMDYRDFMAAFRKEML